MSAAVDPAANGALVVVLVPTEWYDCVRDRAARWVAAWLLDPFLMVRTGATAVVVTPGAGVPTVEAELINRDGVRPIPDLVDAVAEWTPRPALLRVIDAVLPGTASDGGVDPRDEAVTIADVLRAAATARTVWRVALVATPTGRPIRTGRVDADGNAEVPQPRWDVNVLAQPENRSGPGAFDTFVADDEEFVGFVLAHVATVAGLWAGMRRGSFDGVAPARAGRIATQRVTVRAVLHGDRRVQQALLATRILLDDPGPATSLDLLLSVDDGHELAVLSRDRADRVLDELARHLRDDLDGQPLRLRAAAVRDPAWRDTGWSATLRYVLRDVRGVLLAPFRGTRAWADGDGGRATARAALEGDWLLLDLPQLTDRAAGAESRLGEEVDRIVVLEDIRFYPRHRTLGPPAGRDDTAGVWRELHDGATHLLDGSRLPRSAHIATWMHDRGFEGILAGPGRITGSPVAEWVVPPGAVRFVGEVGRLLPGTVRHEEWEVLHAWRHVLAAHRAEAEELAVRQGDGPWPDVGAADDGASEVEASDDGTDRRTPADAVDALAAHDRVEELFAAIEATLSGRLQRDFARREFWPLIDAMIATRADLAALVDLGRRGRLGVRIGLPAVLAAVAPALVLGASALLVGTRLTDRTLGLAVAALGAVLGAVVAGVRIRTARGRAVRRFAHAVGQRVRDADVLLVEWRRAQRLDADLRALLDVLGLLLHHGVDPVPPEAAPLAGLGADDLPRLLRVAVPDDRDAEGAATDVRVQPATLRCLQRLHVAGWRADLHRRILAEVVAVEPGLFGGEPIDVALDRRARHAMELRSRLQDGGARFAQAVGRSLVLDGVRVLDGSQDPEVGAGPLRTRSGMTGSPSARVRVVTGATPSVDVRTDGLGSSIREHPIWDAFLLDGTVTNDPWGDRTYRATHAGERLYARRRTTVHLPARLVGEVASRPGTGGDAVPDEVELAPLRDDAVLFAEAVIKVDVAPEPVPLEELRAIATRTE